MPRQSQRVPGNGKAWNDPQFDDPEKLLRKSKKHPPATAGPTTETTVDPVGDQSTAPPTIPPIAGQPVSRPSHSSRPVPSELNSSSPHPLAEHHEPDGHTASHGPPGPTAQSSSSSDPEHANGRSERPHRSDQDETVPGGDVHQSIEDSPEHLTEPIEWQMIKERLRYHSANKGHYKTLKRLREEIAIFLRQYFEVVEIPQDLLVKLARGPEEALDELVKEVTRQVLASIWDSHIARQNGPAAIFGATIEKLYYLNRLTNGKSYKFPREKTSLDSYQIYAETFEFGFSRVCEVMGVNHEAWPNTWNYMGTIGRGGNGHCGLFVQYNAAGCIVDRVVTKECWTTKRDWNTSEEGVLTKNLPGRVMPTEAYMQSLLAEKREADRSIVDLRTWRLHKELYMYRLYLEHCELGNLEEVIFRHRGLDYKKDQHGRELVIPIAEIAIWAVFETLAHAIYLMKHGLPPSMYGDSVRWEREMLHLDMKPANIFLKNPHPTRWPTTPQFRLGDYGATEFHPAQQFMCTQGFMPPEIYHNVKEEDNSNINVAQPAPPKENPEAENGSNIGEAAESLREKSPEKSPEPEDRSPICDSAANVWSVGANICSLIKRWRCLIPKSNMDGRVLFTLVPQDPGYIPNFTYQDEQRYSSTLLRLVEACCDDEPVNRIDVDELWKQIQAHVNAGPEPLKSRKRKREEVFLCKDDPHYDILARSTV